MAGEDDGTKRRQRWVVVGVTVTLAVLLGGGAYLFWPRPTDHLLVVGDSVSYLSIKAIQETFGSDVTVEPVTRPGYRAGDLLPLARQAIDRREAAGEDLDRAVYLVGYNDVWHGDVETPDLARLVDESARYDCAIWLTFPARPAGRHPGAADFDPDKADRYNERIAELVGTHKNLHLVTDWADVVTKGAPGQYLEADGVHPNDLGAKALAKIMADKIGSDCRFA